MNCTFFDLEKPDNPDNGKALFVPEQIAQLLDNLRYEKPRVCEFEADNGLKLTVGISPNSAFAQFSYGKRFPETDSLLLWMGGTCCRTKP